MVLKIYNKLRMLFLILKFKILYKNVNISYRCLIRKVKLELCKNCAFSIGSKSIISNNVCIRVRENGNMQIGDSVGINNNCLITCRENIIIGNNVLIGPNVMIFDNDHDYTNEQWHTNYKNEKIIIEDDVWIGCGAIILKGTHIKRGAIIGAGTLVKGVVEENCIYIEEKKYKKIKYNRKGEKHYE